jgi:DNA-binding MarR family transcriptional regulator
MPYYPVVVTVEQPIAGPAGELPERLLRLPSFLIYELGRSTRRVSARMFPGPDAVRLPQAAVLVCLADFGPASQREISARLRVDPSDLVTMIDELERAGHVTRRRDQRDRRRHLVELTAASRAVLDRHYERAVEMNDALLACLDEAERAMLRDLLLRVLAANDPRVPERLRNGAQPVPS